MHSNRVFVSEKQLMYRHKRSGFTLLEIMLVLLLIGMVSVGVVMTLPNNLGNEKDVYWQAQRFRTLLQYAEDEALISGLELGLVFDSNSYQFAFYDYKTKKWLPVLNRQIQSKVELPETLKIEYLLSDSIWDELDTEQQDKFINEDELVQIEGEEKIISLRPQVYVMSSGEVTPFSVEFSEIETKADVQSVTVTVSMSGTVSISELSKG